MAERKGGLGRGLDALIPQSEGTGEPAVGFAWIPLDDIKPNPSQPRTNFLFQPSLSVVTETVFPL